MDHQASLRKAIMDSNKISESLISLSEVIAKYDVLLASTELTQEQEEMKKELHNTVLTKVREIPLQALTPLIVKRDDIRRDIVLTMSASMVLMVGQVLAAEYNTTLVGLFEILKGSSVDVDNIIVDYVEGIASYIRKVAIHQHNNPFISTDSENNQIIDSEGLRACHEAGGTNTGENYNLNALSSGVDSAIIALHAMKVNPGVIYVMDDITGTRVTMDYSEIDILAEMSTN